MLLYTHSHFRLTAPVILVSECRLRLHELLRIAIDTHIVVNIIIRSVIHRLRKFIA